MGLLNKTLLIIIPILSILFALLQPRLSSSSSSLSSVNLDSCHRIPGLERCSDSWIDDTNGLAYLACPLQDSTSSTRVHSRKDTILNLYSFSSQKHSILELSNRPPNSPTLDILSLSGYVHSDKDTISLFVISNESDSETDKVIEIFETKRSRKMHAEWIGTVKNRLVRNAKRIVATGEQSFYLTNERNRRFQWMRRFEWLWSEFSDIIHCDASLSGGGEEAQCIVALEGIPSPTSITLQPDSSTLFAASLFNGEITTYEIQSDSTLFPLPQTISLNKPISSIHLSPTPPFRITVLTLPKFLDYLSFSLSSGDHDPTTKVPIEIHEVFETESDEKYYGHQFETRLLMSDFGNGVLRGMTSVERVGDQVLLTDHYSKGAVVCDVPQEARELTKEDRRGRDGFEGFDEGFDDRELV